MIHEDDPKLVRMATRVLHCIASEVEHLDRIDCEDATRAALAAFYPSCPARWIADAVQIAGNEIQWSEEF